MVKLEKKRTNKTKIPVAYGSTKKSIILQRTKHLHRNRCAFEELVGDIDVGGHAAEEVRSFVIESLNLIKERVSSDSLPGTYIPFSSPARRLLASLALSTASVFLSSGTAYGRQTLDFLVRQYEALRGQRLEMLRAVRALSRTERFEKPLENLMTVPGIGQLTGMSLLSEIDDIRRFKSADQLAAFIGMIPMCHSSGEREGVGDITVRRSARLRSVLVEASWVAVRQDPALSMAYGNYCKRMAPGKAIIKIARKLVNRIYFVMKRNQPYVKCVVA